MQFLQHLSLFAVPKKWQGNLLLLPCTPLEIEQQGVPPWSSLLCVNVGDTRLGTLSGLWCHQCMGDTQIFLPFHQIPAENINLIQRINTLLLFHSNRRIKKALCYKFMALLGNWRQWCCLHTDSGGEQRLSTGNSLSRFLALQCLTLQTEYSLFSCHLLYAWKGCCGQDIKTRSRICLTRTAWSPTLKAVSLDSLYRQ